MISSHNATIEGEEHEGAAAVWAFLLVLFFFKLATVILIFWHMRTWESGVILGSTLWYWFPPLLLLGAGPALFYRLRKVRSRREAATVGVDGRGRPGCGSPSRSPAVTPGTTSEAHAYNAHWQARADAPGEMAWDAPGGYGWMGGFARAFLRPAFVFILVAVVAFLIVGIGQLLLALHPEMGENEVSGFASTVQEFVRPDLLTALGLSLVVLFGGAFLSRPGREPRPLDEPVAIGERPSSPGHTADRRGDHEARSAGHLGGHRTRLHHARNGRWRRSSLSSPAKTSTASPGAAFSTRAVVRRER